MFVFFPFYNLLFFKSGETGHFTKLVKFHFSCSPSVITVLHVFFFFLCFYLDVSFGRKKKHHQVHQPGNQPLMINFFCFQSDDMFECAECEYKTSWHYAFQRHRRTHASSKVVVMHSCPQVCCRACVSCVSLCLKHLANGNICIPLLLNSLL